VIAIYSGGDAGSLEEVLNTYLFDKEHGTEDSAKYLHELLVSTAQTANADHAIELEQKDDDIEDRDKNIVALMTEIEDLKINNKQLAEVK
jgi:hypothetical protein